MTRMQRALRRTDIRRPGSDLPLFSVSQTLGVVPQEELSGRPPRAESLDDYKVVRQGEIAFNKMSIRSGALGLAPADGLVTYHYEVMRVLPGHDPRYVVYLMKSDWFISELVRRERGIGAGDQTNVRTTEVPFRVLKKIEAFLPSEGEQRAIADFLDRETAKIDALIGMQQELLRRLEGRQASGITAAVTGASKSSKSCDSVWYPSLPESWRPVRVKDMVSVLTDGAHISPETVDGVFDFVSTTDVSNGSIDFEGSLKTSPQSYEYMVRTGCKPAKGDLLYSKDGTVGESAIVPEGRDFVVASSLVILRPKPGRILGSFLRYALMCDPARACARSLMRGAGLPRISVANVGRIEIPCPPLQDQAAIARVLDAQVGKIHALEEAAQSHIALAQERRSALITAAVTGQLEIPAA